MQLNNSIELIDKIYIDWYDLHKESILFLFFKKLCLFLTVSEMKSLSSSSSEWVAAVEWVVTVLLSLLVLLCIQRILSIIKNLSHLWVREHLLSVCNVHELLLRRFLLLLPRKLVRMPLLRHTSICLNDLLLVAIPR